ncbi:chemotaxis protein CheB [Teichococcus coralli]|uniref:chemotaxis protein CheB n=1 Tax=Teichococcus coralli TaxID=2545983 RepID=UPI0022A7766B|nr:chemotaxis protein CheB [Pseudoroseomonas coralli]
MPESPGLAFVIITHLSPERKSLLHEIVKRYTRLPVLVATDGARVEKDHVYVLPADAVVGIEQQHLVIQKPNSSRRHRKPIDIFFSALAADQGERAAGVVLSGGDGDGTLGIKAIKERGGVTLAQVADGHGPRPEDMPESALSTGLVDFALPADRMGERLVDFARSLRLLDGMASRSLLAHEDEALGEIYGIDGDVVFYSGRTGKYLEAAAGLPSRQLLAMARKGLRLELRTVFREALEAGRTVTREDIAIEDEDGRVQIVTLTAEPLRKHDDGEPLFLVLFTDQGPTLSREEAAGRAHTQHDGAAPHLERELRETRDRLQSLIEEYETALEELKSSNEELVSVNEELQSTNEELEASKEELQSVNEELHTVNADLHSKVDALDRANSDLQNLFNSSDIATIFLDGALKIRSFTPTASTVFNILPGDRGRPITDLSQRFAMPTFTEDLAEVLAAGRPLERRVDDEKNQAFYLLRVAPYLDGDRRAEGVVVSIIDVSNLTRAEARQRMLVAELQHRTRNLLGVVQSIAQRTLGYDARMEAFQQRLAALGRVQSLIGNTADTQIDLGDVVRAELRALDAREGERVAVTGPRVPLGMTHVQIMALALHELATNALKYGALERAGGKLHIGWTIRADEHSDRCLVLIWRESGVPIAAPPERSGYGRELIERALSFSLDARTELVFGEDGVVCTIEMPLPEGKDGAAWSKA